MVKSISITPSSLNFEKTKVGDYSRVKEFTIELTGDETVTGSFSAPDGVKLIDPDSGLLVDVFNFELIAIPIIPVAVNVGFGSELDLQTSEEFEQTFIENVNEMINSQLDLQTSEEW